MLELVQALVFQIHSWLCRRPKGGAELSPPPFPELLPACSSEGGRMALPAFSTSQADHEMFYICISGSKQQLPFSPCTKFELIFTFDKQVKQDSVKKTRIHYPMLALHNPVPSSCRCTQAMGKGRQQPTAGSLG